MQVPEGRTLTRQRGGVDPPSVSTQAVKLEGGADQAEVIGYQPCEVRVTPNSDFVLRAGMAMFWHPSVGPANIGDTMLIGPNGLEVLTPTEQWPMSKIDVKGAPILRPDILQRTV